MNPTRLTLTEYLVREAVPLSDAQAAALRSAVPSLDVRPSWGRPGHFDLRPSSHVGVVALNGLTVLIRPKVPIERVLFLIAYALDPVRWQAHHAQYSDADDLADGMAAIFATTLRLALRQGVLQGYRTLDEALSTVRGRIRFDDQLRQRYGAPLPLEVTYDDFTIDTDLNRLLLAATHRLLRLPLRSARVRSALTACADAFVGTVTLTEVKPNLSPPFVWNRLNQHYRSATELAEMIMRSATVELDHGTVRGTALTIDMNVVFEAFVRTALREALGLTATQWPAKAPSSIYLDRGNKIRLEPDLSWWHERCVFVGDAKYKPTSAEGVTHVDLYQLLAYTTALGLESGMLIYAAGEATSVAHDVRLSDKRLLVRTLDIDGPPSAILERVAELALAIRAVTHEATGETAAPSSVSVY